MLLKLNQSYLSPLPFSFFPDLVSPPMIEVKSWGMCYRWCSYMLFSCSRCDFSPLCGRRNNAAQLKPPTKHKHHLLTNKWAAMENMSNEHMKNMFWRQNNFNLCCVYYTTYSLWSALSRLWVGKINEAMRSFLLLWLYLGLIGCLHYPLAVFQRLQTDYLCVKQLQVLPWLTIFYFNIIKRKPD